MRSRWWLTLVLLLFACKCIFAQEDQGVAQHKFEEHSWEKAKRGLDYSEDKEKKKKEVTPPSGRSFNFNIASPAVRVILFSVIILLLAFVIYQILKGNLFIKDKKIKESTEFTLDDPDADLHNTDLDELLRQALQAKAYRNAIRYYYLKVIKELAIKHWINWQKDKTNREFLVEMGNNAQFPDFRNLTFQYENVWYGDSALDAKAFELISPSFDQFLNRIKDMPGEK